MPSVVQSFFISNVTEVSSAQQQSLTIFQGLYLLQSVLQYSADRIRTWIEELEMDNVTLTVKSDSVCIG